MTTRRRTLLALAGATLAGLAGCAGDSSSEPSTGTPDGTPTATPAETPTATPGENADGESGGSASTGGGVSAEVDLSTASYLVGAAPAEDALFQREENTPRPLSEFPAAFADAVREAQDRGGELVIEEPAEELLTALDGIKKPRTNIRWSEPVVRLEGTAYVVEPQLPVLEVRLGEERREEADPDRTVSYEDEFEHEAVESLVETIAWNGTPMTARGSYKRSLVPDEVEAFLDSYDYVDDERGVSPIVVERHNWEPPYAIELREFTAADRWAREIVDAGNLDEDLREVLADAVEASGGTVSPPYLIEEVPSSVEVLRPDSEDGERPLVRIGETIYDIMVAEGSHDAMPVAVSAAPASPTEDGLARFRLTVEITDDKPGAEVAPGEPVALHSQVGLPCALWIEHGGEHHLLDSDRYEVAVTSEDGDGSWSLDVDDPDVEEISVSDEFSVGDELTATYTVPGTVPAGSYTLPGSFAALWQEDPGEHSRTDGIYPFEVDLTLTES